ncbi:MAG TPA: Ig-like domain-containing protein [Candidatus Limnocylindrales bacterium]|nr:Ig-like domain-containing protein [Candidatus Limnocylindrales bacterium]
MTIRRGSRPAQVRPRPASTGRPPAASRPRRRTGRLSPRAPITRRTGLPLPLQLGLAIGVALLGIVVLTGASGFAARALGGVGGTISDAVAKLTATAEPSASPLAAPDAPTLASPAEPYTRSKTVDITGTLPAAFAGQPDVKIRLYLSLSNQPPAPIDEHAVGATVAFTFPAVKLDEGTNTFTATIVRGDTESDPSPAVQFVRDTKAPGLSISSPKDGATVNRKTVTIKGRTQARSEVFVRNADASVTTTTSADGDGSFSATIALDPGTNGITVTSTDPAGNDRSVVLTVRRGSGRLTASISASRYRFARKSLPEPLTVRVTVLDPDGKPLEGADVTFTISIPGVPAVTAGGRTDATGHASFTTTIPRGASFGTGPASVLVHTAEFGDTTDRTIITIGK